MNTKRGVAVSATLFAIVGALVGGSAAHAQNAGARQKDKNNMRNLGIGLGAVAIQQAVKGKTTNALVLGAGAAYSAKKYEDARKAQARENSTRRVYRYRNGVRVGYDEVNGSGNKVASYKRVYDKDAGRWTSRYRRS